MTEALGPYKLQVEAASLLLRQIKGGISREIHPIWLRERCTDAHNMDQLTGQRLYDPSDLDPDLRFDSIREERDGRLAIKFSDGHESEFSVAEILAEAEMKPGSNDSTPAVELWDSELRNWPRAMWTPSPTNDELAGWVDLFLRYGFVIFSDVPCNTGEVSRVAEVFGGIRSTNFGTMFDIRSVPGATDLALTSLKLDPHTDNPYRTPVPGIQLLHSLANETTGGLSTLVDGRAVALALLQRDEEAFRTLSSTSVRFCYQDRGAHLVAHAPPIELDVTGDVKAIHFSPRLDFVPLLAYEELAEYYRARRVFDFMLRSKEFEIRFLLGASDLVMFDNCRLLHGRTSFDPNEGLRHLQGCYIDIDGPRSLWKVLRRDQRTSDSPGGFAL